MAGTGVLQHGVHEPVAGLGQVRPVDAVAVPENDETASKTARPGLVETEDRGFDVEVAGPGLSKNLAALVPQLDADHVTIRGKAYL